MKYFIRRVIGTPLGQLLIVTTIFMWVVMAIMPFRLEAMKRERATDVDQLNTKNVWEATRAYNRVKSLPPDNEKRLKAQQDLARVCWGIGEYKIACDLYQSIWRVRGAKNLAYDPKLALCILETAGLFRDMGGFDESLKAYQDLYTYEKDHIKAPDKRLARDLNNLGMITYLKAQSTPDRESRMNLLNLARSYGDAAIVQWQQTSTPGSYSEAFTLDNQYLANRYLGKYEEAKKVKAMSDRIRNNYLTLVKEP